MAIIRFFQYNYIGSAQVCLHRNLLRHVVFDVRLDAVRVGSFVIDIYSDNMNCPKKATTR